MIYPVCNHNYRYELNKDMNLPAAHYLPDPNTGKCHHVHGHTYFVNVTMVGNELDDSGLLVNFSDLKEWIHDTYDHTLLNDHAEFQDIPPSSEKLAEAICKRINDRVKDRLNGVKCIQVLLRETPTSYVIYRPIAGDES